MRQTPKLRTTLSGAGIYLAGMTALFFIPDDRLRLVRALLCVGALVVISVFCVSYHLLTRGHWKDTVHGVHIMVFSLAFELIMAFLVLALFGLIPMWLIGVLGAWIYLTVMFLFLWRLVILRAGQRVPRKAAE